MTEQAERIGSYIWRICLKLRFKCWGPLRCFKDVGDAREEGAAMGK